MLLDEPLPARRQQLGVSPECAERVVAQDLPMFGNRRKSPPLFTGLERQPTLDKARRERDAERTRVPPAIGEPPVARPVAACAAALAAAAFSPMRDHVPGIPETTRVVEKGSVGRHP